MKLKKVMALSLAAMMAMSTAATTVWAENEEETSVTGNEDASQKLVVWTLSNDLVQFAEKYCEDNQDVKIENVIIAPADYPTKIQSAMRGKSKEPDIIVGEPQMLQNMYEAGYFEDLNQAPYNACCGQAFL